MFKNIRKCIDDGPEINTKEDAMKTLGIEKEFSGSEDSGVSIKALFTKIKTFEQLNC